MCISDITVTDDELVVPFVANPDLAPGAAQALFFFDDQSIDDIGAGGVGNWEAWDQPSPFTGESEFNARQAAQNGATKLCVVAADAELTVRPGSGNCVDLPAELLP